MYRQFIVIVINKKPQQPGSDIICVQSASKMALLYSTLIFVLFCQLSNTSTRRTSVKVEIDENFTPRRHGGRGIDSNCMCARPGHYSFFDDNTCKPKRKSNFPAHVAECKCNSCNVNITLHCTCDERNNPKSWKATKNICTVSFSSTLKTPICYDSPPIYAVMDFDRCRKGYDGETAQARCQFSCRPVQVTCKSNGIWQYSNESEKCLGEEGNPNYSGINRDGLNFTIDTKGKVFYISCPAGHLMVRDNDDNPAKCENGVIIGNFSTCVKNSIPQIIEPSSLSTTVTMLSTQNEIETTSYQENNTPSNVMERSLKLEDTPLGLIEYLLIVVIVIFLVILAGLWSWYAKDKMRVARLKRAAVDNRNGHPCIL